MEPTEHEKLAAELEALISRFGEILRESSGPTGDSSRLNEVSELIDEIEATLKRLQERDREYERGARGGGSDDASGR